MYIDGMRRWLKKPRKKHYQCYAYSLVHWRKSENKAHYIWADLSWQQHMNKWELGACLLLHSKDFNSTPAISQQCHQMQQHFCKTMIWVHAYGWTRNNGRNGQAKTFPHQLIYSVKGVTSGPTHSSPCVWLNRANHAFIKLWI